MVLWFSGLSGSGKTTIANATKQLLIEKDCRVIVLDGDMLRLGINSDLDFSENSRNENQRRISHIARMFLDENYIVLVALISPFNEGREKARAIVGGDDFYEVFFSCPISICEKRDIKGLYKKARAGGIKCFTGVSSRYECPKNPDLTIDTHKDDVNSSIDLLNNFILTNLHYV